MDHVRAVGPFLFVVLAAAAVAAIFLYEPPVTSIEIEPARVQLTPKAEQRLAASARTALPDPFRTTTLAWSLEPAGLGSIAADGTFRAGAVSGSGIITATVGAASASVAVVIECPQSADEAGLSFVVTCTGTSDVYLESRLAAPAAQTVLRAVDADAARVETDFGRSFARRPLVYVFATKQSFGIGLRDVLAEGGRLPQVAIEADGIYVTGRDVIGIDWEEAAKSMPFTTLRHELTHKMAAQIVGPTNGRALPAWLDEGLARLEESTLPGTQWLAARERYFAVSMAATGTLIDLQELADLDAWGSRGGIDADYQYHEASQAARLLREDVGEAGLVRILEQIGAGKDFAAAYAAVSGKDAAGFAGALSQRLRADTQAPGMATAADTPRGPGLTLVLYGFTPSTQVIVTLAGGRQQGRSVDAVSAYGSELIVVGSELPAGTYTVTAVGANGRITLTARKTG